MKPSNYAILLALTALCIGAAGLAVVDRGARMGAYYIDEPMWPGLGEHKAEIAHITLTERDATGVVTATLHATENGWVYEEMADFPVLTEKIEELIDAVIHANLVERKTNDPERLHRLELLSPEEEGRGEDGTEGTGRRLVIHDTSGQALVDMIIGKNSNTLGTRGEDAGSYLRYAGENQAYLAEGRIDRPNRFLDMIPNRDADNPLMDRIIVHIPREHVQNITIRNDSEDVAFALVRDSEDNDVIRIIAGPDAGDSPGRGDPGVRLFTLLSSLRFEDMQPASRIAGTTPFRRITFSTLIPPGEDNATEAEDAAEEDEAQTVLLLELALYDLSAEGGEGEDDENIDGENPVWASLIAAADGDANAAAETQIEDINSTLSGRIFRLDRNKADLADMTAEEVIQDNIE